MIESNTHSQRGRTANLAIGAWLFMSAFLWHHNMAEFRNALLTGVICFIVALMSLNRPVMRFANTVLALWLFLSAVVIPGTSRITAVNHALAAILMLTFSLVGGWTRGGGAGVNPAR
jgi:hypothetical protein